MGVITPLHESDIRNFLAQHPAGQKGGLGELLAVEPSQDGIENTTYFLTTTAEPKSQQWVLTLIEHASTDQVDFTARLLQCLSDESLPVPAPLAARDGSLWQPLLGKPAWLIPRAVGQHLESIEIEHCAAIGDFLGAAHRAGERLIHQHQNTRGLDWLRQATADISLPDDQQYLLMEQLTTWQRLQASPLPIGAIHADLFHDNALFHNGQLVAVIDFLFGCTDWLLLDVAITVNDWCDDGNGNIDESRAHALLAAYSAHRHFTVAEDAHWQEMLALAATRFWVSRLQPSTIQPDTATAPGKDPGQYLRILRNRLSQTPIRLPLAL